MLTDRKPGAKPKSTAERQAAFKARQKERGRSEVRGIYAPPKLHKTIRTMAREILSG